MASMVPYRSVFCIRPTVPASLFDAFDDMMDLTLTARRAVSI